MIKINDLKVEKREFNLFLKFKKKLNGNQFIKENVLFIFNVFIVFYEDEVVIKVSNIKMIFKVFMVSKFNVICICMFNV